MGETKQHFDDMPTDRYLDHLRTIDFPVDENIKCLFKGDKSNDFYLGMIAGIKTMYEVTDGAMEGKVQDGLIHISIDLQKAFINFIKP